MRLPATAFIGAGAAMAALMVSGVAWWRASQSAIDAGFWWDDSPLVLSHDDAVKLGGALTDPELGTIKRIARAEVEHAFADLRVRVTDDRTAFWRVAVVGTPPAAAARSAFGAAGESHVFGPLGGWGSVGFLILAHNAIEYAPPSASRADIVAAIGRGIGRAAVHEFAHQALGPGNVTHIDNRTDPSSYEFGSADRAEQFYADLHWTTAWPILEQKFGR